MSLYRCLSCVVRNRFVVEKLLLPVAPLINNVAKIPLPLQANFLGNNHHEVPRRWYGKKAKKHSSSSSSSSDSSDSDVDRKGGKKGRALGESDFWRQKMRTHHMAIDVNNDGVVSWDDFETLIKNFETLGNLSGKDLQKFTEAVKHVWEEEWGASGDPYAFIGYEQFLRNMEHVVNTKDLRKKVARPLPYFFNAVDWDSSGEISIDEFKTFYKCLNIPEEAAVASFAAIDLNKDGKLSRKEFIRLGRLFFLSEDETCPSKLFWGPLAK